MSRHEPGTFMLKFAKDLKDRNALPKHIELSRLGPVHLANIYDELRSEIITESITTGMDVNPDVAIMGNNSIAVRENAALLCGFDVVTYCQCVDLMCNEDAFKAHIGPEGQIIQRARQHKLAEPAGAFLWT